MTETEFFRKAADKFPEYVVFICRVPQVSGAPYSVTMRVGTTIFHGRGETPVGALMDAGRQHGMEFREVPRDPTPRDPRWP